MKYLFSFFYQSLNLVVLLLSAYFAAYYMQSHWIAVAVISAAPLLQAMTLFDKSTVSRSQPTKVKLPLVSLLVMLGSAWLVTQCSRGGVGTLAGLCLYRWVYSQYLLGRGINRRDRLMVDTSNSSELEKDYPL